MKTPDIPDSRPDPMLGHLLRARFTLDDADGFAARVLAAVTRHPRRRTSWDVLEDWARPGVAAALAAACALGFWLGTARRAEPPTLADAVQPSEAPAGLLDAQQPGAALVLAAGVDTP